MRITMDNVLTTSQKYYVQLAHLLKIALVLQFLPSHFCYKEDLEISSGPVRSDNKAMIIDMKAK